MADSETGPSWRKPVIYTAAVVIAAAIGATAVFLVGSANRRSDRNALIAYEKAILPLVREAGELVEREMKPTLRDAADGKVSNEDLTRRAGAWERALERIRTELLELSPPPFLTDVEAGWSTSMGGYLLVVDAFKTIAASPPEQRANAIRQATTFGEQADELFDQVASLIQFHRRRLDLGPSQNLPDPTPSATA
jgi:hypothetical protein